MRLPAHERAALLLAAWQVFKTDQNHNARPQMRVLRWLNPMTWVRLAERLECALNRLDRWAGDPRYKQSDCYRDRGVNG